jgi:hypothetical protein
MKTSDEAYEEFVADIILTYFADQLKAGRSSIMESEIWQLLGAELPEGRSNRIYILKKYSDNIIPFPAKNKLN